MIYKGIAGSSGIVIGKAYLYKKAELNIDKSSIEDIKGEFEKVDRALEITDKQIENIREKALFELDEEKSMVFDAHRAILYDPILISGIKEIVENEKVNAAYAAEKTVNSIADMFSNIEDEYLRERAADVKDVGSRLIRNILGIAVGNPIELGHDTIVVAHDLTPSDTVLMDKKYVKGFVTDVGSRTSHTAIMARSLDIPAVLGLVDITGKVCELDIIIVDGSQGIVIVNPDENEIREYSKKIGIYNVYKEGLKVLSELPAVTTDGRKVEISSNIGGPDDVTSALQNGADGVGLYRTEFLYMNRDSLPTENEQFEAYGAVAEKFGGKPIIIRTLDIGGDKKLQYFSFPAELNPFLGWRAIRICLERKDVFKTQLRAILRASTFGNVLIMYPMISGVQEVREANAILNEVKDELRGENIPFDEGIKCGVMIEIPSAAITSDIIINEVDFFSIGTNDLCQYTIAVDRMNEKVGYLYQPFHPAILRLIKNIIDVSHKAGKFTGMCGEMAGETEAAVILLGLGLDEFSMSASSMNSVKRVIRSISMEEAKKIAEYAMTLSTPGEVCEYSRKVLKDLDINNF